MVGPASVGTERRKGDWRENKRKRERRSQVNYRLELEFPRKIASTVEEWGEREEREEEEEEEEGVVDRR